LSNQTWQDVALSRAAEIADLRTMLDSERRTSRDALSELASMTALCDRLAAQRDRLADALSHMLEWHVKYHGEGPCSLCIQAHAAVAPPPLSPDAQPRGEPAAPKEER
jgi:hypothetical protein